jgi:hypothetical protein
MSTNHNKNVDSQMGLKTSFGLLPNHSWGVYGSTEVGYGSFFFFTDSYIRSLSASKQHRNKERSGPALTATVNKSLLAPNVDPTTWLNQSYPSPNLARSIYHSTEILTPLDNVWSGPSLDHPYVSSSAVNTPPIASQPHSFANGVGFGHPLFPETSEQTSGFCAPLRATDDVSVPTWARDLQDPFYNVIGADFIDYAGADNHVDYIHRLNGFHDYSDLALQEATMSVSASHE